MDKLAIFQTSNPVKLFQLAKELHRSKKFFEIFLNDVQYKILDHILEQDSLELWKAFIDGDCTLVLTKDSTDDNSSVEEGDKITRFLALHIRYLLWEKAIDFFYANKSLDESDNTLQEVSDDFDLIDKINEDEEEVMEEKKEEPKVREEEDDYDDDDDDDEEQEEKPKENESENFHDAKDLKYSSDDKVIIEMPASVFATKADTPENFDSKSNSPKNTPQPEPSTPNTSVEASVRESSATPRVHEDVVATTPASLEDQDRLIREFNKVYHNFEYDRETLIKRRKLEKSDKQLETQSEKTEIDNEVESEQPSNMGISLGAGSTSLKHLLGKILQNRNDIPINDYELRTLFMDVRKNRGKWASDERVGQEELYEACEKVVLDLRGWTEHSTPFLNKVSKREAPNYGLIIKKPMDLNTVLKKLKGLSYHSKQEFVDDLMLIWSNCLTYNADPKHFLRAHALAMQKRTLKLIPTIPDITIRNRADVEKEEAEMENAESNQTPVASGKTLKKGRKRTRDEQVKAEETIMDSPDVVSSTGTPAPDTAVPEETAPEETPAPPAVPEEEEEEEEEDNTAVDNENEDEEDPELQAWRLITAKSRANYCAARAELFDENMKLNKEAPAIIRQSREMTNFNHYLDNKEVVSKSGNLLETDEPYLLEYDITGGIPGISYAGCDEKEEEKREQKLVDVFLQQSGGDPNKIKSPFVLETDSGLNQLYYKNITEIQEIRKICFKISLIRQMQTQQFVHHTQMKQPEIETIKEVDVDPISKLSNHDESFDRVQYSVLRRNIAKIAMQTGYETTEPSAINTLAQLAENYLGNLAKTMKLHAESTSSNSLSVREIILASLLENGIDKPDDLYTFVQEKIIKQLDKLKDLRSKLANFLKELLRPGLENFNERSFEDNSEQFMTGDFSSDLGDDFFGFKELGLDKEFKMLSTSIPIYLLHSRLHNASNTGVARKQNKYEDFKDFEVKKLYQSDIDQQIGVLRPFYDNLLEKSKAHFVKQQKKKGESTDLPSPENLALIEDEELPQKQRNIRPRLPPTGKIASVKKKIVTSGFFLDEPEPLKSEQV